jgi:hypothetical protein
MTFDMHATKWFAVDARRSKSRALGPDSDGEKKTTDAV